MIRRLLAALGYNYLYCNSNKWSQIKYKIIMCALRLSAHAQWRHTVVVLLVCVCYRAGGSVVGQLQGLVSILIRIEQFYLRFNRARFFS